jgi:hypothetical protein
MSGKMPSGYSNSGLDGKDSSRIFLIEITR